MIRTAVIFGFAALSSLAHAAPNFAAEENMVLQLDRSSILDESDAMHTQVKKSATQYSVLKDETGREIGYRLQISIEGYTYEEGQTLRTYVVETKGGAVTKIERIK